MKSRPLRQLHSYQLAKTNPRKTGILSLVLHLLSLSVPHAPVQPIHAENDAKTALFQKPILLSGKYRQLAVKLQSDPPIFIDGSAALHSVASANGWDVGGHKFFKIY